MQLYLVRHAQSINNAHIDHPNRRMADPPLTDLGHQQAYNLADYLSHSVERDRVIDTLAWRYGGYDQLGYHIDRIITSPMHRALQTAEPLADMLDVPVKVWLDICERGGLFEYQQGTPKGFPGLTRLQIRAEFPTFDLPAQITDAGWWTGNLESRERSRQRARDVAARLREKAATIWHDEHVMLISHAGFMDALTKALLYGELSESIDRGNVFFFYNTSITRLDFFDNGRIGLRRLNHIPHLTDEIAS